MKHTPQPINTRIRNLKNLIIDGVKLKFSKPLLLSYNNQLKELILEYERDKTKGFLIDNTKNVIHNVNRNVSHNVNESVNVPLMKNIIKSSLKVVSNEFLYFEVVTPKKMVYVGGLGYMNEDKAKRTQARANKMFRSIAFKENKLVEEYVNICNNQICPY